MTQRLFFALVGKSQSGKSELGKRVRALHPDVLANIASYTTRPKAEDDEPGEYEYVTHSVFEEMIANGRLVQWVLYDGNYYGDTKEALDAVYGAGKYVLRPLTETGVKNFREAGYKVLCIGIVPHDGGAPPRTEDRVGEDAERAKTLEPDVRVLNSFAPGGLDVATDALLAVVLQALTGGPIPQPPPTVLH